MIIPTFEISLMNEINPDGAHSKNQTSLRPYIIEILDTKNYAWCACKATSTPPFCDGSHKNL